MKRDTLINRLATRLECPELGQMLRGEIGVEKLPSDRCLVWDTKKSPKAHLVRSGLYLYSTIRYPYPMITFEGRKTTVMSVIFQLMDPSGKRMRAVNECGRNNCCNPLHWSRHHIEDKGTKTKVPEIPEPLFSSDEWSDEDVQEMTELTIGRYPDAVGLAALLAKPELEGAPAEKVRAYLEQIGRPI